MEITTEQKASALEIIRKIHIANGIIKDNSKTVTLDNGKKETFIIEEIKVF
jgi:hypothetical protein